MAKEWRPANWDSTDIYFAASGDRLLTVEELIEAGADAMLHALLEESGGGWVRFDEANDGQIIIFVEGA